MLKFANYQVECTLVFKAPDGDFYIGPYGFVRRTDDSLKIENPTIFNLETNGYFS